MVAVIGALAAYVLILRPEGYGLIGGKVKFEVMANKVINPLDKVSLRRLGNHIVRVSGDGVTMFDYEGNSIWDKPFNMMNPKVVANDSYLAVGDLSSRDVYLFNEEGFIRSFSVDNPIIMFDVNLGGIVVIIGQNEKGHVIQLFDESGKELVRRETFLENDGYPLAMDVSDDGTKMVTSYLFVQGEAVTSNLTFFDFSYKGQKFNERVAGAYGVDGTLIPEVSFLDDKRVSAIGDNQLIFYNVDVKPEELARVPLNNEVKKVTYSEEKLLILMGKALSGEGAIAENTLIAYKPTGEVAFTTEHERQITFLGGSRGKYYIEDEQSIRECYNGKINWDTPLKEEIKYIESLGRNKFLIVLQNEYRVVKVMK